MFGVALPVQPPEYSPALNRDFALRTEAGAYAILVALPGKSLMPKQGVGLLERAVAIARDVVAEVDGGCGDAGSPSTSRN